MQRASKAQVEYIARLQRERGESPDFLALRTLYGQEAGRLIDDLLSTAR